MVLGSSAFVQEGELEFELYVVILVTHDEYILDRSVQAEAVVIVNR